jgi:glyoxylase-like metal-dependent hydrolase (beta-lactamase superfamily II)
VVERRQPGVYEPERAAIQVEAGVWLLDLGFQGRGQVVAAYLLHDGDDVALIETGPSSTLPQLRDALALAGFAPEQLTHLLVTHIHLDHAGAAGPLARESPRLRVYVHPFGAPHMVDPAKLIASASRIYGERMEPLWGEVAPIAAEQVIALEEGQRLRVAGRELQAIFTPGHAWHHVAYWDPESGSAFTGDAAGVRMPGTAYACPPTPPPDLDPDAWTASLAKLEALGARRWYLTHYGAFDDADAHLASLQANLRDFLAIGGRSFADGEEHEALTARLHDEVARRLGDVHPAVLENLEWATPSYMAAFGLQRWAKRQADSR